jgi:hypothetical protein
MLVIPLLVMLGIMLRMLVMLGIMPVQLKALH